MLLRFLDRSELSEGIAAEGCQKTKGTNAFGDHIEGIPELGLLLHKHQLERVEHRAGYVAVESVGFAVEHIGIGENPSKAVRDCLSFVRWDADFNEGGLRH